MSDNTQSPPQQPPFGVPFGRILQGIAPGVPRSADYKDIYSNNARVGITPWDFTVVFALSKEFTPGTMIAEDQVAVRMSPEQFKVVCNSLSSTLKAWEEVFGNILETTPITPDTQIKANIKALRDAAFRNVPPTS
jgi:hypothetical protein